jgi:hypothetical protein
MKAFSGAMSRHLPWLGAAIALVAVVSLGVGLFSACVVENNPPPAWQGPVAPVPPARLPVDAGPEGGASVDAGPDGGVGDDGSSPVDAGQTALRPPAPGPASFLSCAVDGDCVAVRRNGCCNNGYKEAVNASAVAAYQASFACPEAHPICPMFRIRDARTPACNADRHECELLKP